MSEHIFEINQEQVMQAEKEDSSQENLSIIDRIRQTPSVELWENELNRIFQKHRDSEIARLGDVSAYVQVIIQGARNPSLTKQKFWIALQSELQLWQPLTPESNAHTYYILSLISAFNLDIGFIKIAGYLKNGHQFAGFYDTPIGTREYFHLLALEALEKFYPTAPPSSSSAYQTYLDVLWQNLDSPEYFGSCAVRFLNLKELSYNSQEVLDGITRHKKGLPEIIHLIFNPLKPLKAGKHLGYLYAHCKKNNLESYFEDSIKPFGKIIEHPYMNVTHESGRSDLHQHPGVYLVCNDNTSLEISLSMEDVQTLYVQKDGEIISEKLARLITNFLSEDVLIPPSSDEICEELSAIIEKSLVFGQHSIPEIQRELERLGGRLSTDSSTDNFVFILNESHKIPLKISSSSSLNFWVEWEQGFNVSKKAFAQLTDKFDDYAPAVH